jgi:hypothetical protein
MNYFDAVKDLWSSPAFHELVPVLGFIVWKLHKIEHKLVHHGRRIGELENRTALRAAQPASVRR